ncbi:MAG: GxxExxY protein [Bacteroidaceae bacterium]|nr:GxxExxY protein [Bacteroidaceae bacterium]
MNDIVYKDESFAIIGAAMEVYNQLGSGFVEKVYQDALEIEFELRGIPYKREEHLPVFYKGRQIKHDFFVDFICYDKIVIECKAVSEILNIHKIQTLNYIKINNLKLGIVINFSNQSLEYKRIVN